jgi:ABC-2 type transport system ATP-binding protein
VLARGTPDELKALVGTDRIVVEVDDPAHLHPAAAIVAAATGEPEVDHAARTISAAVDNRAQALALVLHELAGAEIPVADVGLRRPTLDDVFLRLTGHRVSGHEADPDADDGVEPTAAPEEVAA